MVQQVEEALTAIGGYCSARLKEKRGAKSGRTGGDWLRAGGRGGTRLESKERLSGEREVVL